MIKTVKLILSLLQILSKIFTWGKSLDVKKDDGSDVDVVSDVKDFVDDFKNLGE